MKCPLCGWDLTPTRSIRFNCWVILCKDWVCYAIKKSDAMRGWKKQYRKWARE